MYGVKAHSTIMALPPGVALDRHSTRPHETREFRVFDKEEVVLDPVGKVSSVECRDNTLTSLIERGWYGFRDAQNGWTMFVPPTRVDYDGAPVLGASPAEPPNKVPDKTVTWTRRGLRVTELVLRSGGRKTWQVERCTGLLKGEAVQVRLPFDTLTKGSLLSDIIAQAREAGVFAKRLGILSHITKLT